ncbi:hypothetical protein JAAARDRAFT_337136 [Jaapia argillacea MUCL 33604]|uniref:Uncharacterized protein n=1 Tax=Jaapia argillacea MUCL 33604 TaxID=933084 RepID=A0A067PNS9_9AGAM|nr:hypothetical protein JAAARDRAFT_337136 [Jaapia argillacea MUCL 33604]
MPCLSPVSPHFTLNKLMKTSISASLLCSSIMSFTIPSALFLLSDNARGACGDKGPSRSCRFSIIVLNFSPNAPSNWRSNFPSSPDIPSPPISPFEENFNSKKVCEGVRAPLPISIALRFHQVRSCFDFLSSAQRLRKRSRW